MDALNNHPLAAHGETHKPKEQWTMQGGRRIFHDHLSLTDYAFRSRRNFSVMVGYSKRGDGAPNEEG